MKTTQAVKEKVCLLFLAIGIGLATVHQVGCYVEESNMAKSGAEKSKTLTIVVG
ncbi:MAG: hypothetical protein OQJ89_10120 [Kangiellaceae bacterium]|nr:hypothetical protein [Kangiellaceae bacterium]MCW8999362.1 hypothetical protein [Kangiellaceae bacterium]MCW9017310.1 hypothetical protein [Kangiellaceae bacterium]